jgi:hypothetical protein
MCINTEKLKKCYAKYIKHFDDELKVSLAEQLRCEEHLEKNELIVGTLITNNYENTMKRLSVVKDKSKFYKTFPAFKDMIKSSCDIFNPGEYDVKEICFLIGVNKKEAYYPATLSEDETTYVFEVALKGSRRLQDLNNYTKESFSVDQIVGYRGQTFISRDNDSLSNECSENVVSLQWIISDNKSSDDTDYM